MRTIVHLSDLHFGRIDERLLGPLRDTVVAIRPEVVAVSGDLTQRARSGEFIAAREFLNSLPKPQIIVPGNHDVPLYNPFSRFVKKLEKYRRYITSELTPSYLDDEIAVVGLSTARSSTFKGGRVNSRQVAWLRERLCELDDRLIKIVVTHHPFDLVEGRDPRNIVGRARMAMLTLAECGADVFLAGHLHVGETGHTATRHKIHGYSALIVQAGTATSTRSRGEANSFNVLRVEHPVIIVERMAWHSDEQRFVPTTTEEFRHTSNGWVRINATATEARA